MATHTRIETRRALIFTPISEGPHPVLCFLHGAGEGATNKRKSENGAKEVFPQFIDKLLTNESPPLQASEGREHIGRFLVVCPQLEERRRWTPDDAVWVDDLVYDALRHNRGDRRNLVLTGFSYGGEGALLLGTASALAWKTIWAVDPALEVDPARQKALPPPPREGVRVWVHHGDAQPGREHRAALVGAFGAAPDPSGTRVIASLGTGNEKNPRTKEWTDEHARTCQVAYGTPAMYEWVLK